MLIDSSMRVYLNNNLFVCFNSVYGVELSYPVHDTAKATITAEHPLLYTPIAQERVYVHCTMATCTAFSKIVQQTS